MDFDSNGKHYTSVIDTNPRFNYGADDVIDAKARGNDIINMFYKMSGVEFNELSFGDIVHVLIKELKVNRKKGYVCLYLYPLVEDFTKKVCAIFIRKKDLFVVGIEAPDKTIYEVGFFNERYRYFTYSQPTGFGQKYRYLFGANGKHLFGMWVGFEVLNEAIMRVINLGDTTLWAWSVGIFALMFSECFRFVWFRDKVTDIMNQMKSVRIQGEYYFMKVLPKLWAVISARARKKKCLHQNDQPAYQKYTGAGADDLIYDVKYARDSLIIYSWEDHPDADNGPLSHAPGDGDGPGYGDGGRSYDAPDGRGDNNIAPVGGGQRASSEPPADQTSSAELKGVIAKETGLKPEEQKFHMAGLEGNKVAQKEPSETANDSLDQSYMGSKNLEAHEDSRQSELKSGRRRPTVRILKRGPHKSRSVKAVPADDVSIELISEDKINDSVNVNDGSPQASSYVSTRGRPTTRKRAHAETLLVSGSEMDGGDTEAHSESVTTAGGGCRKRRQTVASTAQTPGREDAAPQAKPSGTQKRETAAAVDTDVASQDGSTALVHVTTSKALETQIVDTALKTPSPPGPWRCYRQQWRDENY